MGSIGQKHWKFFSEARADVFAVSKRPTVTPNFFLTLEDAFESITPDLVIICNETNQHSGTLKKIFSFPGSFKVLIEKPVFKNYEDLKVPPKRVFVAYQLRLHPLIKRLQTELQGQRILNCAFYVGQHLPQWRPGRDYSKIYSSSKKSGGGVLRDLSHELDLAFFLTGEFKSLVANGGKVSKLEIDSDDSFNILSINEKCSQVNIQMNYLNRVAERFILINTDEQTYKLNLANGFLMAENQQLQVETNKFIAYENQVKYILADNFSELCTFEEGLHILKVIDAAEKSTLEKKWISL